MALIRFTDWLAMRESSPHTRWRDSWLKGQAPDRADVMSRSTPHPEAVKKAEKVLGKKKSKKKR